MTWSQWLNRQIKENTRPTFFWNVGLSVLLEYLFLGLLRSVFIMDQKAAYFIAFFGSLFGVLLIRFFIQNKQAHQLTHLQFLLEQKLYNKTLVEQNTITSNPPIAEWNQSIRLELESKKYRIQQIFAATILVIFLSQNLNSLVFLLASLIPLLTLGLFFQKKLQQKLKSYTKALLEIQDQLELEHQSWRQILVDLKWQNLRQNLLENSQISIAEISKNQSQYSQIVEKIKNQIEFVNASFLVLFIGLLSVGTVYNWLSSSDIFVFCALLFYLYPGLKAMGQKKQTDVRSQVFWEKYPVSPSTPSQIQPSQNVSIQKIQLANQQENFGINMDSCEFKLGQSWIFFGPNGIGKSTLLKIISDIPQTHLFGKIQIERPAELLYWSQNSPEFPWTQTDLEMLKSVSVSLLEFIQSFHLGRLLPQKITSTVWWPKSLSGGEKQKVNLLYLLLQNPKVLLLDEPMSSIPVHERPLFAHFLNKWAQEKNILVILTSHEIFENWQIFDLNQH